MSAWEYKVVPAPTKGLKAKGVKGPEGRFALALETLMNDLATTGWDFQRAETLPSVERAGLTGSTTEWRNVMVFRRALPTPDDDSIKEVTPGLLPAPDVVADTADTPPGAEHTPAPADNGVEETGTVSDMTTSLRNLANQRSRKDVAPDSDDRP